MKFNKLTCGISSIVLATSLIGCGGSSSSSSAASSATPKTSYLFAANDGSSGNELWKTDGTEAGTVLVKDINASGDSNPKEFVQIGSTFYFVADDGVHGQELWKSDGTASGTKMVKDIVPSTVTATYTISNLTPVDNLLFFSTLSGGSYRLFRTDGTEAGTQVLGTSKFVGPSNFMAFKGNVYFSATNSTGFGNELYKSDGTEAGTVFLKDVKPGLGNSNPYPVAIDDNYLYFGAQQSTDPSLPPPTNPPASNFGFWKTDGTASGTSLIQPIQVYRAGRPSIINYKGDFYFAANDGTNGFELWKSDGTTAGTAMLKAIRAGLPSGSSNPTSFTIVGDDLYFTANAGIFLSSKLWKTDGTEAGTVEVTDTNSVGILLRTLPPNPLANIKGKLFIYTESDTNLVTATGDEYWVYENDSFSMLKDINQGALDTFIANLAVINNGSYPHIPEFYEVDDGSLLLVVETGDKGKELWKTDGTEAGTVIVKDINPDAGDGIN